MKSFVQYVEEKETTASDYLMLDKAVLIGVHHGKKIRVMDIVLQSAKRIVERCVWHEGKYPENKVSEFLQEHFRGRKYRSWEPSRSLVNEAERLPGIAISLFGGEVKELRENIVSHPRYEPSETIMVNLLRTQESWYGWHQRDKPITGAELGRLFRLAEQDRRAHSIMKSCKSLGKMARERPVSKLKNWHNIGYKIMWVEEKDYEVGWTAYSRLAKRINRVRDRKLLNLMQKDGGVFFAGNSHVQLVRDLLESGDTI